MRLFFDRFFTFKRIININSLTFIDYVAMPTINLPIFPLSIYLLPQGVTKLRIFEVRYLKMVALAMKNNGFVILPTGQQGKLNRATGSWVDIINFDQSDDGMLLIDVRCTCLVEVHGMSQDQDQLHHGDITNKAHWADILIDKTTNKLATSLSKLFNENTELSRLYPNKQLQHSNWVVARWLELLPIEMDEKFLFIDADTYDQAEQFIESIIFPEQ